MIDRSVINLAWKILTDDEKKLAFRLLFVVILSALFNTLMIASVFPFLELLSDPNILKSNALYQYFYVFFGFSSFNEFVIYAGVLSFFVIIFSTLIQIWRVFAVANFALMRSHSLSVRLFDRYLSGTYEDLKQLKKSDIVTNVMSETQQVVLQIFRPAANIVASLVNILFITTFLIVISLKLTIIIFSTFAFFYILIIYIFRRKIKKLGIQRLEQNHLCFNIVNDALGGIKDVKFNSIEYKFKSKFFDATKNMAKSHVSAQVLGEIPNFLLQGLTFAGMVVAILALVDFQTISTGMGLGGAIPLLGVFAFAGQRIIPEMQRIYNGYTQFQYASESVRSIYKVLKPRNHTEIVKQSVDIQFNRKIVLKNVSYDFPQSKSSFIKNVNLTIPNGANVGIVGASGSGKTTLVDLILGLLTPSKGGIYVDDVKLTLANIDSWRARCAYVPQEVTTLNSSIEENITIVSRSDTVQHERLQNAIEVAQITDFINQTGSGIKTLIGDGNAAISGGQKQRLGIARAVYKDANLVVLDEGTSALDNITEAKLISELRKNFLGITTITIAHRLSTVRDCDLIVVMENGSVVGSGDWETLQLSNRAFSDLVNSGGLA